MLIRQYRSRTLQAAAVGAALFFSLAAASAQTATPPAQPPAQTKPAPVTAPTRKTAAKAGNVRTGVIESIDNAGDTLTLKESGNKTGTYVLGPKTHYNKAKRPAEKSEFKTGDSVVLHFRRSRTDGAMLVTELDDPATWTWLADLRKATSSGVITEISETTLSVKVGPDNIPMEYSISDKTRWEKEGKEVEAAAFKSGDRVFVVPRSLPSGGIMARAVADSNSGAAQEKERLAASVHGTIVTVDAAAHKLLLKTVAGDSRNLAYNDETELVMSGKPQPLTALKPGLHVAARIRHEAGGDESVWRLTLETARKSATPKRRSAMGKAGK